MLATDASAITVACRVEGCAWICGASDRGVALEAVYRYSLSRANAVLN